MAFPPDACDAPELLRCVGAMLDRGRTGAARPLLNAIARFGPQSRDMAKMQARLLEREGRMTDVLALLDDAVTRFPDDAELHLARAGVRMKNGDTGGAATDAADAVVLDAASARAKALLGTILVELRQIDDARACLAEAVTAEPANPGYRQALAHAQEIAGDFPAACGTLDGGILLMPDHVGLRTSAVLLRLRYGAFRDAEALAEEARRHGAVDAVVFGLLGHARSSLGQHAAAADAYEEARKLAPEDTYVRHLSATAGLSQEAGRAAPDYVQVVFDGYAPRFDAHLAELQYRVPGLIRRELAARIPCGGWTDPILDLGCGTGLLAVETHGLIAGPLIGVDLSGAMIALAERRGLYAELHQQDVVTYLSQDTRCYAAVLAGDVLPYFGDLLPMFRSVAAHLAGGGCFVFSLEALPPEAAGETGWRLGALGRYAHARLHVESAAAAAGLSVAVLRHDVMRHEAGTPVHGLIAVLERTVV